MTEPRGTVGSSRYLLKNHSDAGKRLGPSDVDFAKLVEIPARPSIMFCFDPTPERNPTTYRNYRKTNPELLKILVYLANLYFEKFKTRSSSVPPGRTPPTPPGAATTGEEESISTSDRTSTIPLTRPVATRGRGSSSRR